MSKGKKFGWFLLGILPIIITFTWQEIVVSVGLIQYIISEYADVLRQGKELLPDVVNDSVNGLLSSDSYPIIMVVVYLGYIAIFGTWFYLMYVRKNHNENWKYSLKPTHMLPIIGSAFGIQIAISFLLLAILEKMPTVYDNYMNLIGTLKQDNFFMLITLCLLAPIGEEFIFRGVIFRTLKRVLPWGVALGLQAVLFGIYHMNLVQGVYTCLLGVLFGLLAHKYRSVVASMIAHIALNTSSYIIPLLVPEHLQEDGTFAIIYNIAGFVVMIVCTVLALWKVNPPTQPDVTDRDAVAGKAAQIQS